MKNVFYSASFNFLYTQLTFTFHPLEGFYIVYDHIDASFLFLLQKDFYIVHEHIGAFCFFLLQKYFGTFHEPFLKVFLWFFWSYAINIFIYIKKIYKRIFDQFFYILSKLNLPYELCKLCKLYEHFMNNLKSLQIIKIITRNFYVISNIFMHLFFFNNLFTFF